jgi:hypothetical protein
MDLKPADKKPVKAYHLTRAKHAASIREHRFRDSTHTFMTTKEHTGVWVSDRPVWELANFEFEEAAILHAEIDESLLAPYEWIEDGKTYREWLVPAAVLNAHIWRQLTDEEVFASYCGRKSDL